METRATYSRRTYSVTTSPTVHPVYVLSLRRNTLVLPESSPEGSASRTLPQRVHSRTSPSKSSLEGHPHSPRPLVRSVESWGHQTLFRSEVGEVPSGPRPDDVVSPTRHAPLVGPDVTEGVPSQYRRLVTSHSLLRQRIRTRGFRRGTPYPRHR